MKIARRLLSLLLALVMVLALVACGGGGDTTDTGGTSTGPQSSGSQNSGSQNSGSQDAGNQNSNPGTTDSVVNSESDVTSDIVAGFEMPDRPVDETEGKEYIIIQHEDKVNPFGFAQDSSLGLEAQARVDEIQDLYGCTISFEQIEYSVAFASAMQAMMYGGAYGDIIFAYKNAYLRQCLGTGGSDSTMQDLLALDYIINFWNAEKWGDITARESMMAGGNFYGVSPALWPECNPMPYYTVAYNKTIVENAGVTDPQEYWEDMAWDRDAMMEVIIGTTDESSGIWGMTAGNDHMIRATFFSVGNQRIFVDKVNEDGTVKWSNGLLTSEALEAFEWLRTNLTNYAKCFNGGDYGAYRNFSAKTPFINGQSAMCVTRPVCLFDDIVTTMDNFGLITWAGAEPNNLTGYYEQVYSIAIPLFAQDIEHSAFLIADLFEGLGTVGAGANERQIETGEDIIEYYQEQYFDNEIDVECLLRPDAKLQYSYWPNDDLDLIYRSMAGDLFSMSSISAMIEKHHRMIDDAVETHMVPNQVKLDELKNAGVKLD